MTEMTSSVVELPRPRVRQPGLLREIISTIAFVIAAFTLLQLALPRSVVHGRSMDPTLGEGQRLIISRLNYLFGEPQRGDIVVFNSPEPLNEGEPPLIKRLIGKPGDVVEIRDRLVYVNGEVLNEPYINEPCQSKCADNRWELGPEEYFMMGDNRNHSNDSRAFGVVPRENIIGEALFRFWPLDSIGSIHQSRFPSE
ncbi:MAG: signal peptidase I [Anaerolineae bacterium]